MLGEDIVFPQVGLSPRFDMPVQEADMADRNRSFLLVHNGSACEAIAEGDTHNHQTSKLLGAQLVLDVGRNILRLLGADVAVSLGVMASTLNTFGSDLLLERQVT